MNLYNVSVKSFCTVQQISPEDLGKYFIFGVKFWDIHFDFSKATNKLKIFLYEKTYLFIAFEPFFNLFEEIIKFLLANKKCNALSILSNLSYEINEELEFSEEKIKTTYKVNNEEVSKESYNLILIINY